MAERGVPEDVSSRPMALTPAAPEAAFAEKMARRRMRSSLMCWCGWLRRVSCRCLFV